MLMFVMCVGGEEQQRNQSNARTRPWSSCCVGAQVGGGGVGFASGGAWVGAVLLSVAVGAVVR